MFAEDLSAFFDTDDFAVSATIGTATVSGILDRQFVTVNDVDGYHPVFMCATADVSAVAKGAACAISGVNYIVVSNQPDGTGVTNIVLREA